MNTKLKITKSWLFFRPVYKRRTVFPGRLDGTGMYRHSPHGEWEQ